MDKLRRLCALLAAVALVATAGVPALATDDVVTVGHFLKQLALVKQLEAPDVHSAVKSLDRAGVRIPANTDLNKRLTEGDVARLSRLAGLNVVTTRPENEFSTDRFDTFFASFSTELGKGSADDYQARNGETPDGSSGDAPGNGPPFDPYSKGKGGSKGKKKGHRSPTDPE